MSSWIVSTYNGDLQALKNVIENKNISPYARNEALESLLGLLTQKILTREEIIEYFSELFNSDLVKDHDFATFLVGTVTKIHPKELYQNISDLYDEDIIDHFWISKESVDEALSLGVEECIQRHIYKLAEPIKEVLTHVSSINGKDDSLPKLGRNDSCYCGSTKKFKRCCHPFLTSKRIF